MPLRFALVVVALSAFLPPGVAAESASRADSGAVVSALPLGTVVISSSSPTSDSFTVTCSEVRAALNGTLLIQAPQGSPRGLVMFFGGAYGTAAWATNSLSNGWLASVAQAGYEVVQVQWATPGWEPASSGEDAGQAHVACRAASVIRWVHDNLYQGLQVPTPGLGVCGFCLTGNSAGASQISYALAYYGLGPILNGVFPTSGPPHAALAKGCLDQSGYEYGTYALQIIDSSNGYFGGTGPCSRHDPSFTARWNQESVDTNGSSYNYPSTRLHFIFGAQDTQSAKAHAEDYISRLNSDGSPMVTQETVGGMAHEVAASPSGMAALLAAIEAGAGTPNPNPSPSPVASPSPDVSPSPIASPSASPGTVPGHPKPSGGSQSGSTGSGQSAGGSAAPGPSKGGSPIQRIGDLGNALSTGMTEGSVSRVWIWVVVVGLSLAFVATVLLPRIPVLQKGFNILRSSLKGRRPGR